LAQEKALQALHSENERLGLYKDAYAQPEPVAWMDADGNVSDNNDHKCFPIPLYTHPQRTWVGLTGEEIGDEYVRFEVSKGGFNRFEYAALAIEAKLKQKNHVAQEAD
jgi:pyruvate/2-oxoglutarate dehydrogenase complex dihydrolipoamide dehydrogenase (E3) component